PHRLTKLEYLSAATVGVMNAILRPADDLTRVVGSSCKAVIAAWKWRKSPHLVVLPNEPEIDIADVVRRTVESGATPALAERLRVGGLGNTHDDSRGIFDVPCYTAVWAAECAEIRKHAVSPQRSMPVPIRQPGIACRPALVVNAVSPATRSAKIREGRHVILCFCLCLNLSLCVHRK